MRLRYSISAIAGIVLLLAIIFRLVAPSMQFEELIEGRNGQTLTEFEVHGQRRVVICQDPEVLQYLQNMMVASRKANYSDGSGDFCYYYSMNFRMSGGLSYHVWNCYLRTTRTGVTLIGDVDLSNGWPSLGVEFREPAPKNFHAILDFLIDYDPGIHKIMHCSSGGKITIEDMPPSHPRY